MCQQLSALIAGFVLCLGFARNSLAVSPDLGSLDWSVRASHSLAAIPPGEDAVKAFMSKLDGSGPDYPRGICYARFADLEHSGTLSLVVSEADGRFCHLFVVDKSAGNLQEYGFDLAHGADGPEIKDLAGDGNLELVVPADLTGYQRAEHCVAQWPVIYGWTGNGYSDVSRRYKAYYQAQLASLESEIAPEGQDAGAENQSFVQEDAPTANSHHGEVAVDRPVRVESASAALGSDPSGQGSGAQGPSASFHGPAAPLLPPPKRTPPPPEQLGSDCTRAEAAKIQRFLGISRDAGMGNAIRWANSNDPTDREFAAWVLADIGTPKAVRYLRTLSRDANREVAIAGKYALEQANGGPTKYKVERESDIDETGMPTN
jgi:hypothetical protein